MAWNWQVVKDAWTAYGSSAVFVMVFLGVIFSTAKILKVFFAKKEAAKPKDPDVEFLEGALDDPDAPRKPNPNYSYAEFQRDLHDKGLTFEEIYEKCGGVFPQKPPPSPPPVPPILPMSIHEIQGQNGEPGFEGIKGADGPQGPDGRCPDRMTQLQQWFEQRGKDSKVGRVVPPPPNPYPIIHKIYIRGRR